MTSAAEMPVRILHVFATFANGGSQVRFSTIAKQLGSQCEHLILAMDGCYDCMAMINGQAPATTLKPPPKRGLLQNLVWFRKLFAQLRPDLVMTYNWGAMECALATALPPSYRHIHLADGFGPEEVDQQLRRRVLFRRLALARSQAVIVPSHILRDIASETWRVPDSRLALIPNGIDCGAFAAPPDTSLVPGLKRSDSTLVVGTVATLRPEKNIGRLIDATAIARESWPDLQLLIVGDGPERPALQAKAEAMGLAGAVHFAGHVPQPQKILGMMDIFSLSSDTEQMPISIIEAMATGLPIASLDVGDVAMMVSPANRPFVVGPRETQVLATAIVRLAEAPDLRRQLGASNRAHVSAHYRLEQMVEAHAALMLRADARPS